MITRDKIHEVIQMNVGLIQYSNLIPGALMNVVETPAMSNTLDIYNPSSRQSWFTWLNVENLNNLVIQEVKTCKVKHKNNRIQYGLRTYEYK